MARPRLCHRAWVASLVLFALAPTVRAEDEHGPESRSGALSALPEVPVPDLSLLEDAVASQLRELSRDLHDLMAAPEPDPEVLARGYGLLGQAYHAYELLDGAAVCYENASSLAPDEGDWIYLLAVVRQQQGRLEEATELYSRPQVRERHGAPALVRLGEALIQLNRLQEAEMAYAGALAMDPTLAAAHAGLGEAAFSRRDFQGAVESLEAALELVPEANRLHYTLGMAYRQLGETERAREHLERSGSVGVGIPDPLVDGLRENLRGEMAFLLRGRLAFSAGRYHEAARAFEEAVLASPDSARARVNLGTALGMIGDAAGAMEHYRAVLERDPRHPVAHFNLAQMLESEGDPEGALPHARAAVSARPEDVEAQILLGDLLRHTGRDDEALEVYTAAARVAPESEEPVLGLAEVLARQGRYEELKSLLEGAHQRLPLAGRLAHALARVLAGCPDLGLRDGARALDLARRVFAADPAPRHGETLAMALAETGLCAQAAALQEDLQRAATEAGDPGRARVLAPALSRYRKGPPCRPPGQVP